METLRGVLTDAELETLIRERGGERIYVANTQCTRSAGIVPVLGLDAARRIAAAGLAGETIRIPLDKRFLARRLVDRGRSNLEIMRELKVSYNAVARWRKSFKVGGQGG